MQSPLQIQPIQRKQNYQKEIQKICLFRGEMTSQLIFQMTALNRKSPIKHLFRQWLHLFSFPLNVTDSKYTSDHNDVSTQLPQSQRRQQQCYRCVGPGHV